MYVKTSFPETVSVTRMIPPQQFTPASISAATPLEEKEKALFASAAFNDP